ncbi:MAG: hypothetical protein GY944_06260 [bacterium]|nr:hypothetical protein [bacterium]
MCGVLSAAPGKGLQLHGHGVRTRMRLGPEEFGEQAIVGEVTVRRYQCQRCSAVIIVAPRGVLPRLRYGAVAVALALAMWADTPSRRVREVVSPWRIVGDEARRSWRALIRWARGSPWIDAPGSGRACAARITQHLAGHACGAGSLIVLACAGALVADVHHP